MGWGAVRSSQAQSGAVRSSQEQLRAVRLESGNIARRSGEQRKQGLAREIPRSTCFMAGIAAVELRRRVCLQSMAPAVHEATAGLRMQPLLTVSSPQPQACGS